MWGSESDYYQVGGSLDSNASCYVERTADTQLLNSLSSGQFCYVLNPRQSGKSSLSIKVAEQLTKQGVSCGFIDLMGIGFQDLTPQQFYGGLIFNLSQTLKLEDDYNFDCNQWLQNNNGHERLPIEILKDFIDNVVLKAIESNIVIFIDEIESVLRFNFSTIHLFEFIRDIYIKRSTVREYRRLNFVLVGVTTPSDLVQSSLSSPFDLGQLIELPGFTLEEARSLLPGLTGKVQNPQAVLEAILSWTNGQPFLTQKLCYLVVNHGQSIQPQGEQQYVDDLVFNLIINNWHRQDNPPHFRTIQDIFLYEDRTLKERIKCYKKLLKNATIPFQNSLTHQKLILSGLVAKSKSDRLVLYNRIYPLIFNIDWVKSYYKHKWQYVTRLFSAWRNSGS